jgi:hypothetical protein
MTVTASRAASTWLGAPSNTKDEPMDDRTDIANLVGALAVHVDARHWDQLEALFAEEVRIDYTSLFGGDVQSLPRTQLIGQWRQFLPGFTHTTHLIGTPCVTVDRDDAQVFAAVVGHHLIEDASLAGRDRWTVGGCYEMRLQRRDGVWRVASLTLARAWAEGNRDLPRIAGERVAGHTSDPSGAADA